LIMYQKSLTCKDLEWTVVDHQLKLNMDFVSI